MDFFCGPAVLHLDGEEFDVFAYIDSAREGNIEDWGGFVEIKVSDVIRFRAFGSDRISLQVPGSSARDIEVTYTESNGMAFIGLSSTPLPIPAEGPAR